MFGCENPRSKSHKSHCISGWPRVSDPRGGPNVVVIDLAGLNDPAQRFVIVKNIGNACRDRGVFQIINHGITQKVLDEALGTAFGFFNLPTTEKSRYMSNDVHKTVRYGTSIKDGSDKIQFWRIFLKLYAHPLNQWIQQWPDNPPDYGQFIVLIGESISRNLKSQRPASCNVISGIKGIRMHRCMPKLLKLSDDNLVVDAFKVYVCKKCL
ncbi:hypothetical protein L6452_05286 [Arctium lappa]|uniref:Uncharacterized protein n=1 Tax=Arctium lappa TaxID=4217 RepID=A0ACB9EGM2_ARCLA|nr:hypothetical protein L6452_05286 [Arctium lappa]